MNETVEIDGEKYIREDVAKSKYQIDNSKYMGQLMDTSNVAMMFFISDYLDHDKVVQLKDYGYQDPVSSTRAHFGETNFIFIGKSDQCLTKKLGGDTFSSKHAKYSHEYFKIFEKVTKAWYGKKAGAFQVFTFASDDGKPNKDCPLLLTYENLAFVLAPRVDNE